MILSICIPTYNRPEHLINCLNSIAISKKNTNINFEVCISDNFSNIDIKNLIRPFKKSLDIKFNRHDKNLGYAINLLKSVSMAKGEFVWTIGNDDLLLPHSLKKIESLLKQNSDVDFFYINSYNLHSNHLKKYSTPFDTLNLPSAMKRFSQKKVSEKLNFWDLVDPEISYDFLLGMFLTIFRRKKWNDNLDVIDNELIQDTRYWSNFDNTCPHIKIFASAFNNSNAYFQAEPLSVNLFGLREWGNLYEFVEIVRIPEVLDLYRKKGISFTKFIYCKNYALRNFVPYLLKIFIHGKKGGLNYIKFYKHILKNLIYPNVYLSFFYFIFRKISFNKSNTKN